MNEIPGHNGEVLDTEIRKSVRPDLAEDLITATARLLNDAPPPEIKVDAVFFHGRSFFDAEKRGIFTIAADLAQQGAYILQADTEGERHGETIPHVACPGKSLWTDRLVNTLRVDPTHILFCPHPVPGEHGFNTKTEAEAFLATSAERGFKSAVVLTQPHQIVRAMLGVVKTISQRGQSINVWCVAPQSTDWERRVKGSQGKERKPRREHIQDEIQRIFTYQAKGDIAGFDELFSYLAKRDQHDST